MTSVDKFRSASVPLAILAILAAPGIAGAQPAPSFRAGCAELRASVRGLAPGEEGLVTIEVLGSLTAVQSDGALAYLTMCAPPDPQVLCVTYATDGLKPGDRVMFSGALAEPAPHHFVLDPCLHSPPPGG